MKKRIRNQPRIPGLVRESAHAALAPQIKKALEKDAIRYSVSKSWVAAVILAKHYGIEIPEY